MTTLYVFDTDEGTIAVKAKNLKQARKLAEAKFSEDFDAEWDPHTPHSVEEVLEYQTDFLSKYSPHTNEMNPNALFGGCMFETLGEELEYVMEMETQINPGSVWTIVSHDEGLFLEQGFHTVNRMGYIITSAVAKPEDIGKSFYME